jgi:hypothetical protein
LGVKIFAPFYGLGNQGAGGETRHGVAGVQIFEAFEKICVSRADLDGEGLSTVIILFPDRMITWTAIDGNSCDRIGVLFGFIEAAAGILFATLLSRALK